MRYVALIRYFSLTCESVKRRPVLYNPISHPYLTLPVPNHFCGLSYEGTYHIHHTVPSSPDFRPHQPELEMDLSSSGVIVELRIVAQLSSSSCICICLLMLMLLLLLLLFLSFPLSLTFVCSISGFCSRSHSLISYRAPAKTYSVVRIYRRRK